MHDKFTVVCLPWVLIWEKYLEILPTQSTSSPPKCKPQNPIKTQAPISLSSTSPKKKKDLGLACNQKKKLGNLSRRRGKKLTSAWKREQKSKIPSRRWRPWSMEKMEKMRGEEEGRWEKEEKELEQQGIGPYIGWVLGKYKSFHLNDLASKLSENGVFLAIKRSQPLNEHFFRNYVLHLMNLKLKISEMTVNPSKFPKIEN